MSNMVEVGVYLSREFPGATTYSINRLVEELFKIAKRNHHYNVADCNYGLTPRQKKAEEALYSKVETVLNEWLGEGHGVGYVLNGDPRGAPLKLILPSGASNSAWESDKLVLIP